MPVPGVFEHEFKSTDVGRGDELHEEEDETLVNAHESESVMTYASGKVVAIFKSTSMMVSLGEDVIVSLQVSLLRSVLLAQ